MIQNKTNWKITWIDIIIIFLLAISPVIINTFIIMEPCVTVGGTPDGWLAFYGGLIGSLIVLYVLYKTLQRNHYENENNRKLQLSILEYQQKLAWLNDLKSKLVGIHSNYNLMLLLNMGDGIKSKKYDEVYQRGEQQALLFDANELALGLMFPPKLSNEEVMFFRYFNNIHYKYMFIISDLMSYCDLLKDCPDKNIGDYAEKKIKNLHESDQSSSIPKINKNSIYEIISKTGYDKMKDNVDIIVNERLRYISEIDLSELTSQIQTLIDYEHTKIDSILKIED